MSLLSKEHLESLVLGQEFSTPGPLHALAPDIPIVWRLYELHNGKNYHFTLRYFGAKIGGVLAKIRGQEVLVEYVK